MAVSFMVGSQMCEVCCESCIQIVGISGVGVRQPPNTTTSTADAVYQTVNPGCHILFHRAATGRAHDQRWFLGCELWGMISLCCQLDRSAILHLLDPVELHFRDDLFLDCHVGNYSSAKNLKEVFRRFGP